MWQALERASLGMQWPLMQCLLSELHRFPRLRRLELSVHPKEDRGDCCDSGYPDCVGELEGSMLSTLGPALEHLKISNLECVTIRGDTVALPALAQLRVSCYRLQVDALLPRLRSLTVASAAKVSTASPAASLCCPFLW